MFRKLRNLFVSAKHDKNERPVDHIAFLGLWDTVAAYGLPVDEMTRGVSRYLWPLELPDRQLDPRVRKACHALSLDDERTTFHPLLWDERLETVATGTRKTEFGTNHPGLVRRRAFQCRRRISGRTRSPMYRSPGCCPKHAAAGSP